VSHQEAPTPAPLPPRLLAHLRRWKQRKLIATCFVEFNGKPVASVKKGFKSAVELAGLIGKVTPHTLRHTAAIWLMQRGVPVWEAAGFLGMSAGSAAGNLWTPPPRSLARGRRRDWTNGPRRFGGRNGGRLDRGSKSDEKL
jgi:integrase